MPRIAESGKTPDLAGLFELANSQAGYFNVQQARAANFSSPLLEYHIKNGKFQRVLRGVFRIAHYPADEHEDLAIAWLWSEQQSVFSHQTALFLYDLSDVLPSKKHMTLPTSWKRRRLRVPKNFVLHFADLAEDDKSWIGPVPVTTPLRTIIDCEFAHVSPEFVQQAIQQALHRGLFSRAQLKSERTRILAQHS